MNKVLMCLPLTKGILRDIFKIKYNTRTAISLSGKLDEIAVFDSLLCLWGNVYINKIYQEDEDAKIS